MEEIKAPQHSFGIMIHSRDETTKLKELVYKYYSDWKIYPEFNASSKHCYYTNEKTKVWHHYHSPPSDLTEVLTVDEFIKKYLTKPEVINNYNIY